MTCDTGLTLLFFYIFKNKALDLALDFPASSYSGRSHVSRVTAQKTTCPVQIVGCGAKSKAGRCSLLTSLRAVPEI